MAGTRARVIEWRRRIAGGLDDRLVDEGLGEGDVVPEDELDSVGDAVDCCVVSGEGETGR